MGTWDSGGGTIRRPGPHVDEARRRGVPAVAAARVPTELADVTISADFEVITTASRFADQCVLWYLR